MLRVGAGTRALQNGLYTRPLKNSQDKALSQLLNKISQRRNRLLILRQYKVFIGGMV